ncbi:MAG: PAT family beta-lactamase induction signal transducer AmpG [Candidatus Midichloriaceae bacterium]|jgi:PAT family beta-lactamase induction signal transducer AmpG
MCKKFNLIKNVVIVFFLGISSGLPITITASVLRAFLFDYSINLSTIGILGLVATPYTFKFLWAPFIDNWKVPFFSDKLGNKKVWIFISQIILIITISLLGQFNPNRDLFIIAIICFFIAFASATQDIAIDAYRIHLLKKEEQGMGASSTIYGYRIGMIISGIGGLYLAEIFGWSLSFIIVSLALIPAMLITAIATNIDTNKDEDRERKPLNFREYFINPLKAFVNIDRWYLILLLLIFYKLSDAYLGAMTMPFIMSVGYTKIEIANAVKSFGMIATLVGTGVGGFLVLKLKTKINLLFSEILSMLSNLPFLLLNIFPKDLYLLSAVNGFENFTSSIANIAMVAYMSNISKNKYVATTYAILTSITVFGRTILSSTSGLVVESVGWDNFFVISSLLSLPSLVCILVLFSKKRSV